MTSPVLQAVEGEMPVQSGEGAGTCISTHEDFLKFQSIDSDVTNFVNSVSPDSKANFLHSVYLRKTDLSRFHKSLATKPFFESLRFSAFAPHSNKQLYIAAYRLLIYLAESCRWSDFFLQTLDFFGGAKHILMSGIAAMPEHTANFIVHMIRIDDEAFSTLFTEDIFAFFMSSIANAGSVKQMLWPLQSIQGIVSYPGFNKVEIIEPLIDFIQGEVCMKSLDQEIIGVYFSILSCIFLVPCSHELLEKNALDSFMDVGKLCFNPLNEVLCMSILSYYINAVYFDDSIIDYLISSSIIQNICLCISEMHSPHLVQRTTLFLTNCLTNKGKSEAVLSILMGTGVVANLIPIYGTSPIYTKNGIVILLCHMIMRSNDTLVVGLFSFPILDILLDEFVMDDETIICNILCSIIRLINAIQKDPTNFGEIIEGLNDPFIEERLDEIIENTDPKQNSAICSIILQDLLSTIQIKE